MSGVESGIVALEVMNNLKIVADGIQNIRTIRDAIRDGEHYIQKMHPDINKDLLIMLNEMKKSLKGLAEVSSVLTEFDFTVSGSAMDLEPSRFNDYLIKRQKYVHDLRDDLESLQGSCRVIREHAEILDMKANELGFGYRMMILLGVKSEKREKDVTNALFCISDDEMRYHNIVTFALDQVEEALKDVRSQLGPRGMAEPKNVPKAAQLLGRYAESFENVETEANNELSNMKKLINDLTYGRNIG